MNRDIHLIVFAIGGSHPRLSSSDPIYDLQQNLEPIVACLQAMNKTEVKHLIFLSSSAVYGDISTDILTDDSILHPISPYGLSKLTAENYLVT